jgi:hypothetical protein
MDNLKDYYVNRIKELVVIIAMLSGTISSQVIPILTQEYASDSIIMWAIRVITSTAAFSALFIICENFIRNKLWKMENPEYDFSGKWVGTSIYEIVEGDGPPPKPLVCELNVEQDCLSSKLSPVKGGPYASNWGSIAFEIDLDKEGLSYAYYANGLSEAYYPSCTNDRLPTQQIKGLEETKVIKRDEKKRPLELSGTFSHCAQGQKPLYRGTVNYKRK